MDLNPSIYKCASWHISYVFVYTRVYFLLYQEQSKCTFSPNGMCHILTELANTTQNVLSGVNEVQWGKIKSTKASGVVQLHAEGSQSRFRNPMPFNLHNNFTNETPELMLHFCTHISRSQWQCKLPNHELGTTCLHHFHRVALWTQAKNLFPRKKTPINTFLLYL